MATLIVLTGEKHLVIESLAAAPTVQVLPSSVASSVAKASANTSQWQSFKAGLDGNLGTIETSSYQWSGLPELAADYALGYQCLKSSNPTLAADYAGKALALLLSAVRDEHSSDQGPIQLLARGDGVTTQFTLPGAPVSGTLTVWLCDITEVAVVRNPANDPSNPTSDGGMGLTVAPIEFALAISNTSGGAANYVKGVDWVQGKEGYGGWITWISGTKPANSATYYVTRTNGRTLQSSGFSVAGSTLTFSTPPAANKCVAVKHMYHGASAKYQQTGNGVGGFYPVAHVDNTYPIRYVAYMAMAYDWIYDFSGFTSGLKTEVTNLLGRWYEAARDTAYRRDYPASNYGAGAYVTRAAVAAAVDGRHASSSTYKSQIVSTRTSTFVPAYQNNLVGGWNPEGWSSYGSEAVLHDAMATLILNDAGIVADVSVEVNYANQTMDHLVHSQWSDLVNNPSGIARPGSSYSGGDIYAYPVPMPTNTLFSVLSAMATGDYKDNANWMLQNGAGANVYDHRDLLFRDPNATAANWFTRPLDHHATGGGLIAFRSDWNLNASSTWAALHCEPMWGNGSGWWADHLTFAPGHVELNRGDEVLVVNGAAFGRNQDFPEKSNRSNHVLIDSGKGTIQDYRWSQSRHYGPAFNLADVSVMATELSDSQYGYAACDYANSYKNFDAGTTPASVLQREMFFLRSGAAVVFDRVTTTDASYAKVVPWNVNKTSSPVTSGTFTLTVNSQTTASLAYNASAATVQAAIEALSSVGTGNVNVEQPCQGWYRVSFLNSLLTQSLPPLTGAASNGAVVVYDLTPSTLTGTNLRLDVFLAAPVVGDQYTLDTGTNKAFIQVYNSDGLTSNAEPIQPGRVTAWLSDNTSSYFNYGTTPCQRVTFKCAAAVAATRFVSVIELAASAQGAMSSREHIVGANSKLQGARLGSNACLFRRATASFAIPETVAATYNGTLSWHVAGLVANTMYGLTGANDQTVTASANGIASFTSTSSSAHSVTIADPPAPPSASYTRTLTDVGMNTAIAAWKATNDGTTWAPWHIVDHYWDSSDYPGLIVSQHGGNSYGTNIFRNACNTPGGTISFTNSTAGYGVTGLQLSTVPGCIMMYDVDGDSVAEWTTKTAIPMSGHNFWKLSGGTLAKMSGVTLDNYANYPDDLGDFNQDGKVDVKDTSWPSPLSFIDLNSVVRRTLSWNGTTYTASTAPFAFPSGVPQPVIDDVVARLKALQNDKGSAIVVPLDLNNDGLDDLVIAGYCSYESQSNFAYYLINNGNGTYSDMTVAWGLPRLGTFCPIQNAQINVPRMLYGNNHYHKSIKSGTVRLYIGGGSAAGEYEWNGSGYTKQTSSPVTDVLANAVMSQANHDPDNYMAQIYALDLTNSGRYDLIYHRPITGRVYLFLSDGAGNFTQDTGTGTSGSLHSFWAWTSYGFAVADFDNDGKLDIALGGTDPVGSSGSTTAATLGILRNTTQNPGKYLKVKLRRATTSNPYGIGGWIEVYQAGTSTLIGRHKPHLRGGPMHFGVGSRTSVDLKVLWPDGTTTTQPGVSTNQTITVTS